MVDAVDIFGLVSRQMLSRKLLRLKEINESIPTAWESITQNDLARLKIGLEAIKNLLFVFAIR